MTGKTISDGQADCFFLVAVAVLLLNFASQVAAFPLQVLLIIYAVLKSDIKLFPALFLALLDKAHFPDFGAELLKLRVGIALGAENVFLIAVFIVVAIRIARNQYADKSIWGILVFWLLSLIPAWVMSSQAKSDGLDAWQEPVVYFLTPALYFWGWSVGRTWEDARQYFIKRMSVLLLVLNCLSIGGHFYVFTFARSPLSLGLAAASITGKCTIGCRLLALGCALVGLIDVIFARYLNFKDTTGYTDAAELGSTFTTLMTIVFCFMVFAIAISAAKAQKTIRLLPVIFIVPLVIIFFYAVGRAKSNAANEVTRDYRSFIERFEFKLIGDRGTVWADGMQDVARSPLFFKRYKDRLILGINKNGEPVVMLKMPPHNQILKLLACQGWWLGLFCIVFLFWMHFRMFNRVSLMLHDRIMICSLLAPSAAVFYAVGLTGQSVWSAAFTGNGLVTLIFPGVIYGAWQNRRNQYIQVFYRA